MSGERTSFGEKHDAGNGNQEEGWNSLTQLKMEDNSRGTENEKQGGINEDELNKNIDKEKKRQEEAKEQMIKNVTWESEREGKEDEILDALKSKVDEMINGARAKGDSSVELFTTIYKDMGVREIEQKVSVLTGLTENGGHLDERLKELCRIETAVDSIIKENNEYEDRINQSSDRLMNSKLVGYINAKPGCEAVLDEKKDSRWYFA